MHLTRRRKIVFWSIVGVIALTLAALLGIRLLLPEIIRSNTEEQLEKLLHLPVEVPRARLNLLSGKAAVSSIEVTSPDGFYSSDIFTLRRATIDSRLGSLLGDRIEITNITIDQPRMYIDVSADGRRSFRAFLDALNPNSEAQEPEAAEDESTDPQAPPEANPAPQEEEKKEAEADSKRSIQLDSLTINRVGLFVRDEFATAGVVNVEARIGRIVLAPLELPPGETMELRGSILDLVLITADRWQNPQFLEIPAIEFDILVPIEEGRDLEVRKFSIDGFDLTAETVSDELESQLPDNVYEFVTVIRNAFRDGEPDRFSKERKKKRDKRDKNEPEHQEQENVDITGAVEPAEPGTRFTISDARLNSATLTLLAPNQDPPQIRIDDLSARLEDASFPYFQGDSSRAFLNLRSEGLEAGVVGTAKGALFARDLTHRREYVVTARALPLYLLGDVKSGIIDGKAEAIIENSRMRGSLQFTARDVEASKEAKKAYRLIYASISYLSSLGIGRRPIEFDVPLQDLEASEVIEEVLGGMKNKTLNTLGKLDSEETKQKLNDAGGYLKNKAQDLEDYLKDKQEKD